MKKAVLSALFMCLAFPAFAELPYAVKDTATEECLEYLESGLNSLTITKIESDWQTPLNAEIAARENGDNTLTSSLATETAARIAGDANLQGQIDGLTVSYGLFVIDANGDFEPSQYTAIDPYYELDSNSDIMPRRLYFNFDSDYNIMSMGD